MSEEATNHQFNRAHDSDQEILLAWLFYAPETTKQSSSNEDTNLCWWWLCRWG
jgi:hypothetical protein